MLHIFYCHIWLLKQFEALQLQAGLATMLAAFQLRTFAGFGWRLGVLNQKKSEPDAISTSDT